MLNFEAVVLETGYTFVDCLLLDGGKGGQGLPIVEGLGVLGWQVDEDAGVLETALD